jgi:hypothetical protein
MSVQPCPFYLQGRCKYGDICRLPHSSPITPPNFRGSIPKSSPMIRSSAARACMFYNKGICSQGSKCAFLHVPSAKEPSLAPINTRPNPENAPIHPILCIYFMQQRCRAGNRCAFSHDASDSARQPPPEGGDVVGSPKPQRKAATIRRPDTMTSTTVSHLPKCEVIPF